MVLKYIKSIWQSNYISQARTEVTTFIDTADEQLQSLETFTKRRDRYFFHKLSLALITALLWSITLLVTLSIILILWVGDIIGSTGDESYKEWSKRIESSTLLF